MHFPEALTLSITVAAIDISHRLTETDTALLGAILSQLGDTLTTISAARQKMAEAAKIEKPPNSTSN